MRFNKKSCQIKRRQLSKERASTKIQPDLIRSEFITIRTPKGDVVLSNRKIDNAWNRIVRIANNT